MLEVDDISFSYDSTSVINKISFSIEEGQNLAIIGESGCGKSTLLKLIYGFYDLEQGSISWSGNPILGPKFNLLPGPPFMKYLAQDFDLMPYVTVAENVGKYLSNVYPEKKRARVEELLEMVEMSDFAAVKAKYLSGGQQQRVAIARVLALEPAILLLDEPFSNIDSFRKNALRRNLFVYLKRKNITCIVATHDSADALSFSDEIIAMRAGKIVQYGQSQSLYLQPKNYYVASLFGEVNTIKAHLLTKTEDLVKTILVYSHELFTVEYSSFKVTVKKTYFKGNNYLIKSLFEGQVIFFESLDMIDENKEVYLSGRENVFQKRLQSE